MSGRGLGTASNPDRYSAQQIDEIMQDEDSDKLHLNIDRLKNFSCDPSLFSRCPAEYYFVQFVTFHVHHHGAASVHAALCGNENAILQCITDVAMSFYIYHAFKR